MSEYVTNHIKCFNPSSNGRSDETRKKIYHYTSPTGLFSILKNKTIRFTDCQFLNDKSEYKHIKDPLKTALEEIKNKLNDNSLEEIINKYITDNYELEKLISVGKSNELKDIKFEMHRMRYYVFCATDLADSLGMWNYYVKNGNYQGYNIGININDFLDCFAPIKNPRVDVFYGKVIYNEAEKINILKDIIQNIDIKLSQIKEDSRDCEEYDLGRQNAQGELITYLEDFRLFFKDSSFSSEKEYRFVIRLPLSYVNKIDNVISTGFEMKNGILTPSCELKLDKVKTISSITLSPMLETELAENGLIRFLKDNEYSERIKLNQSKIPIRY